MRTLLVVGSDTGVGKTQVVSALARLLAVAGAHVQIVKPVETGAPTEGDARRVQRLAGIAVESYTLRTFAAPLSPPAAAKAEGVTLELSALVEEVLALPSCDWRLIESAGGVATPLDDAAADWTDFALAVDAERVVVVVPDRLGAISQARLAYQYATRHGAVAGVWLNATQPHMASDILASNRAGLASAGVPLWAEQGFAVIEPKDSAQLRHFLEAEVGELPTAARNPDAAQTRQSLTQRCQSDLAGREQHGLRRVVRRSNQGEDILNLADNDYLALASDPCLAEAAAVAAQRHGTSASASPLISGWREPHERLVSELCAWHGFPCGLLWSSGYAANSAVLGVLPQRGDLVLADRLVHHSMIAGLLRSGARLQRYEHLHLDQLDALLEKNAPSGRTVFVVTESIFSMDGDYPDLARMAALKRRYGFVFVVDEAHALGWYGVEGAGLVRAAGVAEAVDVLIGTLGKTLASGGAYSLFRDENLREYLVNHAGEFIYSTALSPVCAAVASAALGRVRELSVGQSAWRDTSRAFRARLQTEGWNAAAGDSPIVPVRLGRAEEAVALAAALREKGILVGAVRPPTVPVGTSRLRLSLKRTFDLTAEERVLTAMNAWRTGR